MHAPSRSIVLPVSYTYTTWLIIASLVLWATGIPYQLLRAQGAQLSDVSNVISTSKPGVGANHTISFTTPSGVPADGTTIEIELPSGFSTTLIEEDDVDIEDDGTDLTTGAVCGAVEAGVSIVGQTVIVEICSGGGGAIAPGSVVTIEVGTHASASGAGSNQVANSLTAGDYPLLVGGTMEDEGRTRIVIVRPVIVTGEVDTFLSFEISGVDAGVSINGDATLTTGTTTATTVAFGIVEPESEYVLGQDVSVTTNTVHGFTVRVFADGDLESSGGATINAFANGAGTAVPTTWAEPSSTVGSPDTYGHWGVTTEDFTLSDNDSFGTALYAGDFIDTPREVMYATSSANGTEPHIGRTRVGYKLEIGYMQEAATEYSTTLSYVVTPIF